MNRPILYISAFAFIIGCKSQPDTNQENDPAKTYKLQVSPSAGSNYHYDITNETIMNFEVSGKEIKNINKADVGISYKISRDSSVGLLFTLQFDKIHLYSKNGDKVKEMDADNSSALSVDPSLKLLGVLKQTTFQSSLSSGGEVKIISGVKEISDKIIAAFPETDAATRTAIESEWNKIIVEKLVRQNTSQLFQIFPDTPVHAGSTWKTTTKQEGELPFNLENVFKIKTIDDEVTVIQSTGTIANIQGQSTIPGIGTNVTSDLKGEQEAEYKIETKTGMMIDSKSKGNIKGTIHVMGQTIPINIKTSVKIDGRKMDIN